MENHHFYWYFLQVLEEAIYEQEIGKPFFCIFQHILYTFSSIILLFPMDNLKIVIDNINKENEPIIVMEEDGKLKENSLNVDLQFLSTTVGPRSPKKLPKIKSPSKSPLGSGNWQVSEISVLVNN